MDTEVLVLRKKPVKGSQMRSAQAINQAQRSGAEIETTKKFNAGSNKHPTTTLNSAKLDREDDVLKHKTVDLDTGKLIAQVRQVKGLTQKDLATKICEKPQVVNDYEAGRAIPNQQILTKLERALGVKLRGKDKGQPLGGPKAK
ncbi:endothelial differentiation-related factor 1-like isoform X2 [Varroa jacobsoni]|uniref:HTH cro/C1-type domain-containing protein n=1 Tax=Varroa destructor TaxID=109461 RepID=A0A7M7JXI1_VARDE|nr:endothelial differentiation-related factor 1-like [Varroa destructor]XP_022705848.1 endothelial differentiation-related factor 1-like isoform X2 [Varroa jacobsoni]